MKLSDKSLKSSSTPSLRAIMLLSSKCAKLSCDTVTLPSSSLSKFIVPDKVEAYFSPGWKECHFTSSASPCRIYPPRSNDGVDLDACHMPNPVKPIMADNPKDIIMIANFLLIAIYLSLRFFYCLAADFLSSEALWGYYYHQHKKPENDYFRLRSILYCITVF